MRYSTSVFCAQKPRFVYVLSREFHKTSVIYPNDSKREKDQKKMKDKVDIEI